MFGRHVLLLILGWSTCEKESAVTGQGGHQCKQSCALLTDGITKHHIQKPLAHYCSVKSFAWLMGHSHILEKEVEK